MGTKLHWDDLTMPEPNSGCLLWVGARNHKGYGIVCRTIAIGRYRTGRAHRAVWERAHGPIPQGMFVCHKCDTPCCVEESHLFLGTATDNMADMVTKGRHGGKLKDRTLPDYCIRGHLKTLDTVRVRKDDNSWKCRECERILDRARRERQWLARERR